MYKLQGAARKACLDEGVPPRTGAGLAPAVQHTQDIHARAQLEQVSTCLDGVARLCCSTRSVCAQRTSPRAACLDEVLELAPGQPTRQRGPHGVQGGVHRVRVVLDQLRLRPTLAAFRPAAHACLEGGAQALRLLGRAARQYKPDGSGRRSLHLRRRLQGYATCAAYAWTSGWRQLREVHRQDTMWQRATKPLSRWCGCGDAGACDAQGEGWPGALRPRPARAGCPCAASGRRARAPGAGRPRGRSQPAPLTACCPATCSPQPLRVLCALGRC